MDTKFQESKFNYNFTTNSNTQKEIPNYKYPLLKLTSPHIKVHMSKHIKGFKSC